MMRGVRQDIGLQLAHPEDVRHANLEFRNIKIATQ